MSKYSRRYTRFLFLHKETLSLRGAPYTPLSPVKVEWDGARENEAIAAAGEMALSND